MDWRGIETTGASWKTSQQDKLGHSGVEASRTMAQTDLGRMNGYKDTIESVGREKGVEPAILAGIISRESRAGNALDAGGRGDGGRAFGLMQVDTAPVRDGRGGGHTATGSYNSREHIAQGADIYVQMKGRIQNKFPQWSEEQQAKGALAAYNRGQDNVHSYHGVDANTTDGDYSNDVMARAQFYKQQGYN